MNNTSQYFDLLTPDEHEAFVDCGCFDASTEFHFAGWCGRKGYEDIIAIPKLILELRPDYKLYIRHYSLLANETVLYAC